MNRKNILKLLKRAFDEPQYNIKSFITKEEKALSLKLEVLTKDFIKNSMFIETYHALRFENANGISDSIPIEDFDDGLFNTDINSDLNSSEDAGTGNENEKKAVKYWKSGKKRKLTFDTIQCRFKRLNSK